MTCDYLIVGAGIFGATVARQLTDAGKRVLVIDRAPHVAGMAYTERRDGQMVQAHGGHIYHTNSRALWDYVNRYAEFKQYCHHVKATAGGRVYSFPPNLMTYQQLGVEPGCECAEQIVRATFFEGYTAKQWGRPIAEVPVSVLRRIPLRTTWDDRYFSDDYQGLPTDGYTALVENMLKGIPVELGQDYASRTTYWNEQARRVIYTGPVDALMGYTLGRLEYRGLRFEHERRPVADYQGVATMNYCDAGIPWLRIEEWRHWWAPVGSVPETWITRTYPDGAAEPMYPVNDDRNHRLYDDYVRFVRSAYPSMRLGGRMGLYKYFDMAPAIAAALQLVERELA